MRTDRAIHAALPASLNPLAQTGAIANTLLAVALVTGIVELIWYSPSLTHAYSSLEGMRARPYTAQLMRSMHRYSSDACMFFVLLHALRMFFARRFGGPRSLAWITGIVLVGLLWFVGWLGYWLVWDQRAQQVAVGTARMLDAVPIFGDPPSRSFLTDRGISSLLFFIVFFFHMLLPLGMGIFLWIHITRLSRSKFFTARAMTLACIAAVIILSIALPATSAPAARMAHTPGAFRFDAWYLLPLALTDRLGNGALWSFALLNAVVLSAIPWMLARRRATPAEVEVSRCNSCRKCYEDCPYQAITMVPRSDGRDFEAEAKVDPSRCVGCGICAGSCDSAGVGLPWLPSIDERHRIDAWIDGASASASASADGGAPFLAFVCAESAGASLRVDAETGRCEDLEGFRVFQVPCIGWVHMLSVERALRHGAGGVCLVSCGTGDCQYREGATWTAARLDGSRAPALRDDKVDVSKVRFLSLDRLDASRLKKLAQEFRRGVGSQPSLPPRARAFATITMLATILGGATLAVANVRYPGPPTHGPRLVVSFKHPGASGEHCRVPSAEELARTPAHMRRERICERGRAPVRMRIFVDGRRVHQASYRARGLHEDEPSIAIESVAVPAGTRTVRIEIGDTRDPGEWAWHDERSLDFRSGRRRIAVFDRATGFVWE